MKIIVVGGTGTIGRSIVELLSKHHEVIVVGHQKGDYQLDMTKVASIEAMYKKIGKFDALISAAGHVHFAPLTEFDAEKYMIGLQDKLMGQVNLVLLGMKYINDAGSFALTSGILSDDPIRAGTGAAMVNGAINAFVKSAAIEMTRNIRINAISPTVLTESMDKFADYFAGFESVPASRVALAYSKSVEGAQTGQVYTIWR